MPDLVVHDLGCSEPCTCGAWDKAAKAAGQVIIDGEVWERNTYARRLETADVELQRVFDSYLHPSSFVELARDDDAS